MNYEIVTDSSANLTDEQIEKFNLSIVSLSYFADGNEHKAYVKGVKTDNAVFYNLARQRQPITTSLPSYNDCMATFTPILEAGKDILYIGFSSGLSGTFQMLNNCLAEIIENYPQRKFLCVDGLCAAMGQGLLLHYALKLYNEGKTMEEIYDWLEQNKLKICHWFTVDDLFFLKRGGRISGSAAIAGTMLSVKPIMHVDDDGKLVLVSKVNGRKKSLNTLVDNMERTMDPQKGQTVFISHGDCIEDAEYVAEQIRNRFGMDDITINYLDPVIAVHAGPGTVALFFMGNPR